MHRIRLDVMMGLALAALAVACQDKPAAPAAAAPAKAAESSTNTEKFHAHMQEHFVKADEVERMVVAGNLEAAKAAAAWIGTHEPPPDLEARYSEHVAKLQIAARQLAGSNDPISAAEATARMAAACAGCHAAAGKTLDFGSEPMPEAGPTLQAHMERHAWGLTRMWDGLVGGEDALWTKGLAAMDDLPELGAKLVANPELKTSVEHMSGALKTQLDKAREAKTLEARGSALAGILATCGSCHEAVKGAAAKAAEH